jgi:hypothetical protein
VCVIPHETVMSLCNCRHQFYKNIPVSFDFVTTWYQGVILWTACRFKFYCLLYCVVGRVLSTCVSVPRDIVTANLSLRTPTSARGSECSCRTGDRQRVALVPGQNRSHVRLLTTGRLHPDCTSHVTSWVHAMSTATSQSMSSKSHCRIHFYDSSSWVNLS